MLYITGIHEDIFVPCEQYLMNQCTYLQVIYVRANFYLNLCLSVALSNLLEGTGRTTLDTQWNSIQSQVGSVVSEHIHEPVDCDISLVLKPRRQSRLGGAYKIRHVDVFIFLG